MSTTQCCCVSELEGTLLNNPNTFAYFMLVAFEASGLIRFAVLLLFWPVVRVLEALGFGPLGLRLTVFVSTVGLSVSELESVARAVLPKFLYDDVNMEAWRMFSRHGKRIVVTKMPRVMVERFVKEHLQADEVVGTELVVTRFGFVNGSVRGDLGSERERVAELCGENTPCVEMGRSTDVDSSLSLSKHESELRPVPVIFHDGRLVKLPTPSTALLILLWLPVGIVLATIRIVMGLVLPMWAIPYFTAVFGGGVVVRGNPPRASKGKDSGGNNGILFVCTHRTLMDPVILSYALRRRIPAVTYSISRLTELLSPIPTVRLTRVRHLDASRIRLELTKNDLVVCPEGTTCREPFLLRFSALFAELTDRIVPVAMDYRVGFFHATTARGSKALDPVFFFMNPRPLYEVTFLNELPAEATCSAGNTPHEVANYVQKILAATLGFECTNFTRRDKYRLLAGNDGNVVSAKGTLLQWRNNLAIAFKPFIH